MSRPGRQAGTVSMLLAAAVGGAHGQDAPARELPTVLVTAQKREQAAQNVPVSLTAISGKDLEAAGIDSAALLDQVAAGLTVGMAAPGYLTITLRGISDLTAGCWARRRRASTSTRHRSRRSPCNCRG